MTSTFRHRTILLWAKAIKCRIGFSGIHPTKLKENVDWVKHSLKWRPKWMVPEIITGRSKWMKKGLKKEFPTRLAYYNLRKNVSRR